MSDSTAAALERLFMQPFTSSLLGEVLAHDFDTHRHLLHVGVLCTRTALAAGLSFDEAVVIGQAGLFHDVAKLHWQRALLSQRVPLNDLEWSVVRAHAAQGAAMLRERGATALARIVRGHHERLDGSGYPDGLRGAAIPEPTRLLAVVDTYDCLRAGRPYAAPVTHEDALERLSGAPQLFDREAVAALVRALAGTEAAAAVPT